MDEDCVVIFEKPHGTENQQTGVRSEKTRHHTSLSESQRCA